MLRKLLATMSVLLLSFGITSVVAGPAAAHAGNMTVSAVCNTDTGMYDVTYTLKWTNSPSNGGTGHYRLGENSFINNWAYPGGKSWTDFSINSGSGSKSWTQSLPGTTVNGPWTYAYIEWSDGYNQQKVFDTRVENLKGDCKQPSTKVVPVAPTIVDLCGTANDSVTPAANTANITYTKDGSYVWATLSGSNVEWGTAPSGWAKDGAKMKYRLPAFNTDPCSHTEVVCWLLDNYKGGDKQPGDGAENTFSQKRVDCDDPVPCGMWVQKDTYLIDTAAKEEVWQNLGDRLEWINGKPEDHSIYKSHVWIYGGKCKPEKPKPLEGKDPRQTQLCTAPADGTKTITSYEKPWTQDWVWNANEWKWELGAKVYGAEVQTGQQVVDDAQCIPNAPDPEKGKDPRQVQLCNVPADGTATITYYETTWTQPYVWSASEHKYVLGARIYDTEKVKGTETVDDQTCVPQTPDPLQGKDPRQLQLCNVPADGTATITYYETSWTQSYAWNWATHAYELQAKVYSPEVTTGTSQVEDATCIPQKPQQLRGTDPLPPSHICIVPADGTATETSWAKDWTQDTVWNPLLRSYTWLDKVYGEPYVTGTQTIEAEDCTPPTLEGTVFAAECKDDVPWIVYDVKLNDPYGLSTDDGTATFTFTAPGSSETFTKTVPIGNGQFLWPGATATDNGDGTYTATGWPGWALDGDEWVSVGDENYGWTRDGVDVLIEVNPEMTVHLNYPPPTALCVAGPPEVHGELDAPPAKVVEAEAQYAG
ncbi:hypothetical protein [Demequina sp.]|uniref:hypothetical protein n=1 Tax=Demequina sp. TaxID=2050685 RepID=UPI003D0E3DDA